MKQTALSSQLLLLLLSSLIVMPGCSVLIEFGQQSVTHADCGDENGSIDPDVTLTPSGANVTYSWTDEYGVEVATTEVLSNAAPGEYRLQVSSPFSSTMQKELEIMHTLEWEDVSAEVSTTANGGLSHQYSGSVQGASGNGAGSRNFLLPYTTGRLEFEPSGPLNIGFSTTNTGDGSNDIHYGFAITPRGYVIIHDSDLTTVSGRYASGSTFTVERTAGGEANYYLNRQLIHSASSIAADRLMVDAMFIAPFSGGLSSAHASFGKCNEHCPTTNNQPQENDLHWTYTVAYDEEGNIAAEGVSYADKLGRKTQNQSMVQAQQKIVATEIIYDDFGRPALTTLAAPIEQSCFGFQSNFFTNENGRHFDYTDFTGSKRNNPSKANQSDYGSVGFYYSDNNGENRFAPSSDYPYTQIDYTNDPSSSLRKSSMAGAAFRMGSGREKESYDMPTAGELEDILGNNKSFFTTVTEGSHTTAQISNLAYSADKIISIDEHGRERVEFTSAGLIVAQAFSGITSTCSLQSVSQGIIDDLSLDIHLPASQKSSLSIGNIEYDHFSLNPYTESTTLLTLSDIELTITDLQTDAVLVEDTDFSIDGSGNISFLGGYASGSSFLRISVAYIPSIQNLLQTRTWINYKLDYSNWTVNLYDLHGRLKQKTQPNGTDCNNPGVFTHSSTTVYNDLGQVISVKSPDEGTVTNLYNDKGQLRFSQNSQQVTDQTFTYIVYDEVGRVQETGIYDEAAGSFSFQDEYAQPASIGSNASVLTIVNSADGLDAANKSEVHNYHYNRIASGEAIPSGYSHLSHYSQSNLRGKLAKVENEEMESWFGYDSRGRRIWKLDQILDSDYTGIKTALDDQIKAIDYEFNSIGRLEHVIFEKHTSDTSSATSPYLKHQFIYNADGVLTQTKVAKVDGILLPQAEYRFDALGKTQRMELGDELQGIDYVYTINGLLKSINHPSLDNNLDPGQDGKVGSDNSSFHADVFGMSIDYYQDDYQRQNSGITSAVSSLSDGLYNGLVKSIRYKTQGATSISRSGQADVVLINGTDDQLMNRFTYNDFKEFTSSTFGVFDNSTAAFTSRSDYLVNNITYDRNGNITALTRNGYDGTVGLGLDQLSYTYSSGSSQLASVSDAAVNTHSNDFNTAGGQNFTYNQLGQLVSSQAEGITNMTYNALGKVQTVTFSNGNKAHYAYDNRGNKYKTVFEDVGISKKKFSWYVYNGKSVTAIFEHDEVVDTDVRLAEQPIYGHSRIGIWDRAGDKFVYELKDHLGNIRATIRDNAGSLNILSWADYYPFGKAMPGRQYTAESYRYGYQGQEKAVNSNWSFFELRLYNASLGRWLSPDPKGQFSSPYLAMANNPVQLTDPDGGWVSLDRQDRSWFSGYLARRQLSASRFASQIHYQENYGLPDRPLTNINYPIGGPPVMLGYTMMRWNTNTSAKSFEFVPFVDQFQQRYTVSWEPGLATGFVFDHLLAQWQDEQLAKRKLEEKKEKEEAKHKKEENRRIEELLKEKNNGKDNEPPSNLVASVKEGFMDPEGSNQFPLSMTDVAPLLQEHGWNMFMAFINDSRFGPEFFIESINEVETSYSEKEYTPYFAAFGFRAAGWGHTHLPDELGLDEMRHQVASFLTAHEFGPLAAYSITSGNEAYGFFRNDAPRLLSRIRGESAWSFSMDDFRNNRIGIEAWQRWNLEKQ